MDPLVTAEKLVTRLQADAAEIPEASAELAVRNASGLIRGISGQVFTFVSQETVEIDGSGGTLTLPQRPVVINADNPLTVLEVGQYGDADFPAVFNRDFTVSGAELRRGYPSFYRSRLQGWPYHRGMGVWSPLVRVTYSHGYFVIPDDIEALALDIAQALASNPRGLRSFSTPEYSETFATELLGAATVQSIKASLGILGRGQRAFSIKT